MVRGITREGIIYSAVTSAHAYADTDGVFNKKNKKKRETTEIFTI